MRLWLRAHRWYFVALVVLVPTAILVALSTDWWGYAEAENGRPVVVAGYDRVEFANAEFAVLEWHSFDADSDAGEAAALLPGTSLVTITLGVTPGTPGPFCRFELTDTSGQRSWPEASYSDADFEIASDAESYCSSDSVDPYRVQVFFVVPEDAADHPRLRLEVADELPAFLSFEL